MTTTGPVYGGNLYGRPRMVSHGCSATPVLAGPSVPAAGSGVEATVYRRTQETGRWQVKVKRTRAGRPLSGAWHVYSPDWTTWHRPIEITGPMARAIAYATCRAAGQPHNVADVAARGYVRALRERGIDPR